MSTTMVIPVQHAVNIYQQKDGAAWGTRADLRSVQNNVLFTAWLPENFEYSMASEYDNPFQAILGDGLVQSTAQALGMKIMSPIMTAQLWAGSSNPDFSLTCYLEAETNTDQDVKEKFLSLLNLVTPSIDPSTGMLVSPGPSIDVMQAMTNLAGYLDSKGYGGGADIVRNAQQGLQKVQSSLLSGNSGKSSNAPTARSRRSVTTYDSNVVSKAGLSFADKASSAASSFTSSLKNSVSDFFSNNTTNDSSKSVSTDKPATITGNSWLSPSSSVPIRNQISLSLGMYLYFPSIVITNVSSTVLHQFDAYGRPMSMEINISFRPLILPTQEDYANMFSLGADAKK